MRAGLNEVGWQEAQLAERRKCDPAKVKLAMRVRTETTMTLKWIAARLHMGTWTNLSNLLSQQRRKWSSCQSVGPVYAQSIAILQSD